MELKKLLKVKKSPSNFFKVLIVGLLFAVPTLEALAQSTGPRNGRPRPVAGVISTNSPTVVCASDNIPDIVRVTVRGVVGNSNWFVTDEAGVILGKATGIRTFSPNLEGAGRGTCFIYHVANRGYIRNVPVGGRISSLIGRISFSNRIAVTRLTNCNGTPDPAFTPLSARSMTVGGDVFVDAAGGDSVSELTVTFFSAQTGTRLGTSRTRVRTSADGEAVRARISLSGLSRATTARVIVKVRDAATGREYDSRILYVPEFKIQRGGSARI